MKIIESIKRLMGYYDILFCDLDGTLIVTRSGKTFPQDKDDWQIRWEVLNAIRKYRPKYVFIVSNQGGIEKGYVSCTFFIQKLRRIIEIIKKECKVKYVDGRWCSSNDKCNYMRKPNPGMVEAFKHDYIEGYDFDNYQALMIGDASGKEGQFSDSDLMTARNAGIRYMDVEDFVMEYNR